MPMTQPQSSMPLAAFASDHIGWNSKHVTAKLIDRPLQSTQQTPRLPGGQGAPCRYYFDQRRRGLCSSRRLARVLAIPRHTPRTMARCKTVRHKEQCGGRCCSRCGCPRRPSAPRSTTASNGRCTTRRRQLGFRRCSPHRIRNATCRATPILPRSPGWRRGALTAVANGQRCQLVHRLEHTPIGRSPTRHHARLRNAQSPDRT